jgi:hypothetical protein
MYSTLLYITVQYCTHNKSFFGSFLAWTQSLPYQLSIWNNNTTHFNTLQYIHYITLHYSIYITLHYSIYITLHYSIYITLLQSSWEGRQQLFQWPRMHAWRPRVCRPFEPTPIPLPPKLRFTQVGADLFYFGETCLFTRIPPIVLWPEGPLRSSHINFFGWI